MKTVRRKNMGKTTAGRKFYWNVQGDRYRKSTPMNKIQSQKLLVLLLTIITAGILTGCDDIDLIPPTDEELHVFSSHFWQKSPNVYLVLMVLNGQR